MARFPIDDCRIAPILEGLAKADPQSAWNRFLNDYAPLLLQVVQMFEREPDPAGDCFVFVCEQLHRDKFRRLRRFQPGGKASFNTWLRVVVRNLCLDWHRQASGRHQLPQTIAALSPLDQRVFHTAYHRGLPPEDCFLRLRSDDPELTMTRIDESLERIEKALTPRQRWLLQMRRPQVGSLEKETNEDWDTPGEQIPDDAPDPETSYAVAEEHASLHDALAQLSASERLLLRLRFDQELTLLQIARLMELKDAQTADRRIREILEQLKKHISPKLAEKRAAHPCQLTREENQRKR